MNDKETKPRKEYIKPEVVHELELETRAGSGAGPLGGAPEPNPLDALTP